MVMDDWRLARSTVAITDQSITQNLGYSFASLSRLVFAFYKTGYTDDGVDADINGSRSHRNLNEYSFTLNGQNYPAQKVKCNFANNSGFHGTNMSEVLAEIRSSSRLANDYAQETSLTKTSCPQSESTGAGADGIGTSFYELDLESLRQYGDNDVYSGLYTIGGTTALEATMSKVGTAAVDMCCWGQYQATLTLDTRNDNIFSYKT
jgi:hypothetical protein